MTPMPAAAVQTTTELLEKDRVKLRVEVPEAALKPAMDAVYRKWANEIRVPGFRKGKIPRQMIDARVGVDAVREEALQEALPQLYRDALQAEDLEPIAPPEIDVVDFQAGSPLIFEATVDVRPEITLPDLSAIEIESPPSEVTDEDMDEQIERLRDRFAELETVGRDARRGDHVLMDLKGFQNDELVEGLSAPDFLYEVGSRTGPPKLDEELEGTRPGAILKFTDEIHIHRDDEHDHDHSSTETVSFTVLVKEVKTKKLPAVDDEFAKTVGEFESLDDLKEDLRARLATVKERMIEEELRTSALNALVEASGLEPPEKLVESEFTHRMEHLEQDLQRAGLNLDAYGAQVQLTELEIRRDLREQAGRSVKAELLLEEIAREQKIDVSEEELGREIALAAAQAQRDPKEIAQNLVDSGRVGAVAADIMRRKALDYVVRSINVTGRVTDDS
jgi:trigger factor